MIEEHNYRGHRIEIIEDCDAESPREWDNIGTMACWHRRYKLGDVQPQQRPQDYRATLPRDRVELPLYLYDHGGITMATQPFDCPWDSGQVGFIYASHTTLRLKLGIKRVTTKVKARAYRMLHNEVETYDAYLRGDVCGYSITGPQCSDSCWGYYSCSEALQDAKQAIDSCMPPASTEEEDSRGE